MFSFRALLLPLVATFQVKMAYFGQESVNMRKLKNGITGADFT
jgi:hypothetical protein